METNTVKKKQPKVLYLSFISAMTERFGYYVISFLLVLIMKEIYHLSDSVSFKIFAMFTALGYLTPAFGGYLADKLIGIKRCWGLGLLIEMTGFILLALPSNDKYLFTIALGCIIIGAGIFKTAPTNMLGRAYTKNDSRIDSGFTLYYMGINVGSFTSSLIAGPVKDAFGWGIPFAISAVGLFLGFIWFMFFKHHGDEYEVEVGKKHLPILKWVIVIFCCLLGVMASATMMQFLEVGTICFYTLSGVIFLILIWQIIIASKIDRKKIIVCLMLIFLAIGFFILYMQLYQSVVLFLQRNVNRDFLGYNVPVATYLGLNAVAIIILSPILASIYTALQKRKKGISITVKFPFGLVVIGLSFLILYLATFTGGDTAKISSLWIVLFMLLYSFAELLIGALGVAMITRIAPAKIYGLMMGAWFFIATGLSAQLSSSVASWADVPVDLLSDAHATLHIYGNAFLKMALFGFAFAIVGFILGPWLKRQADL